MGSRKEVAVEGKLITAELKRFALPSVFLPRNVYLVIMFWW